MILYAIGTRGSLAVCCVYGWVFCGLFWCCVCGLYNSLLVFFWLVLCIMLLFCWSNLCSFHHENDYSKSSHAFTIQLVTHQCLHTDLVIPSNQYMPTTALHTSWWSTEIKIESKSKLNRNHAFQIVKKDATNQITSFIDAHESPGKHFRIPQKMPFARHPAHDSLRCNLPSSGWSGISKSYLIKFLFVRASVAPMTSIIIEDIGILTIYWSFVAVHWLPGSAFSPLTAKNVLMKSATAEVVSFVEAAVRDDRVVRINNKEKQFFIFAKFNSLEEPLCVTVARFGKFRRLAPAKQVLHKFSIKFVK